METYYTVTRQAGSPTAYKFMDPVGRTLREKTTTFGGDSSESSTIFNRKGEVQSQLSQVITPDGTSTTVGSVTFGDYDALGRPETKTVNFDPQQYTVTYTYAGLTTDMAIKAEGGKGSNRTITRTVNSAGKLMTSIDEAGLSTRYRYNAAGLPSIIEGPTQIQCCGPNCHRMIYQIIHHNNYLY